MKILVKFSNCGYDDYELSGYKIYDKTEWDQLKIDFSKGHESEWWWGTNQSLEVESDWLTSYEEVEISEEEIKFLSDQFGDTYGNFCNLKDLIKVS